MARQPRDGGTPAFELGLIARIADWDKVTGGPERAAVIEAIDVVASRAGLAVLSLVGQANEPGMLDDLQRIFASPTDQDPLNLGQPPQGWRVAAPIAERLTRVGTLRRSAASPPWPSAWATCRSEASSRRRRPWSSARPRPGPRRPVGAIYLVYGGTLQDPPEEALDPNHPELRWAAELGAVVCGESGAPIGAGLAAVQEISGAGAQLVSTTTKGRYAYVLRDLLTGDAETCADARFDVDGSTLAGDR